MQGRYLRHPFLCLSIYPVVEVSPQGYWKYPSLVAVVVAEETGTAHIKQCVQNMRRAVTALTRYAIPVPKTKKATYNCPVVVPQNGARHV